MDPVTSFIILLFAIAGLFLWIVVQLDGIQTTQTAIMTHLNMEKKEAAKGDQHAPGTDEIADAEPFYVDQD